MNPKTMTIDTQLGRDAATVLGFILFEYSRLDMELGLLLVWSDDGSNLEGLTAKLNDANFSKRLEYLEKLSHMRYAGSPAGDRYAKWLSEAHDVRTLRNQLFHGRWGVMPQHELVANVVGVPTSSEQTETRYSLEDLQKYLDTIRSLRAQLATFWEEWPL